MSIAEAEQGSPLTRRALSPIIRLMKPFLLEVGTEEIPPSFLAPAAGELERRIRALLAEHEIEVGPGETFYTPRRLAVRFASVAVERPARTVEVQGPPVRAAFDKDGKPNKTGAGFARSHGRTEKDLIKKSTPKGEYVFVSKEEPALPTTKLLAAKLADLILGLPFAKTMRWHEDKTRFARPIRWLVCLLGDKPVEFSTAGLTSSDVSYGHRGTEKPVRISNPTRYEPALAGEMVVCRPETRRDAVLKGLGESLAGTEGEPVLDPELVEETVNITEYPVPVLCRFDEAYLSLPSEVLITALKKHQRSFAVRGKDGKLLPSFVAVADTPGCDRQAVGRWYEQAVESRLRDARFYFEQDMAKGLEPLVEEEKRVTWIEGVGTYFDKTEHLRALCSHLAGEIEKADARTLDRAALLAKADLLTNMVREKEFTSLQGRMGGIYARLLGEPAPVADAIAEQYLPTAADGEMPATLTGACLGIADRIDSIVATFLTGAIPTGSEDPFALRRQATAMMAIILQHNLDIDLDRLVSASLELFPSPNPAHSSKLRPFFQERLEALLGEKDIPYDITDAVLETTWHHPPRALASARALLEFRSRPDFERLIIGQKRVANILKGQDVSGLPDRKTLTEPAEKDLWSNAGRTEPGIDQAMARHEFVPALELLLTLREPIDRLFDDVLVMAEDEKLRMNRLRLLSYVRSLFRKVADLSRVVIEGEKAA